LARSIQSRRSAYFLAPLGLLFVVLFALVAVQLRYANSLYPGVTVLGADVGGMSRDDALATISRNAADDASRSIAISYGDHSVRTTASRAGLAIDERATLDRAFDVGRSGGVFKEWTTRWSAWRGGRQVAPVHVLDSALASNTVQQLATRVDQPVRNAALTLGADGPRLRPSQVGQQVDVPATVASFSDKMESVYYSRNPIAPVVNTTQPTVVERDLATAHTTLQTAWSRPLELQFGSQVWGAEPDSVHKMIKLTGSGKSAAPMLDARAVEAWVMQVATEVDRPARNARIAVRPGDASLVYGWSARKLDAAATVQAVKAAAFAGSGRASAVVAVAPPNTTNADLAPAVEAANTLIGRPLTLAHGDQTWTLSMAQLTDLLRWSGRDAQTTAYLDPNGLSTWVRAAAADIESDPRNARILTTGEAITLAPDHDGLTVSAPETLSALEASLQSPEGRAAVVATSVPAAVQSEDLQAAVSQANLYVGEPLELTLEDETVKVSTETLRSWLSWTGEGAERKPVLDAADVGAFAADLAASYDRAPVDARISVEDGAHIIVPGRSGLDVDADETAAIVLSLASNQTRTGPASATNTAPTVTANELTRALSGVKLLTESPITLSLNGEEWTIGSGELVDWLRWSGSGENVSPYLDPASATEYVQGVAQELNTDVQNSYISTTGDLPRLVAEIEGVEVDETATSERLLDLALNRTERSGEIVASSTQPEIGAADLRAAYNQAAAWTEGRVYMSFDGVTWWLDPEDVAKAIRWTGSGADVRPYLDAAKMEAQVTYWINANPPQPAADIRAIVVDYEATTRSVLTALEQSDDTVDISARNLSNTDLTGPHNGNEAYWNGALPSKWIDINLTDQSMAAYEGGTQVRTSLITTGRPELRTPTGEFRIMAKLSPYKFVSPWPKTSQWWYPTADVSYSLRFRAGGFYIHDAPWRNVYGPGTNSSGPRDSAVTGSHGCVNTPLQMMDWLFPWAEAGTPVLIHY